MQIKIGCISDTHTNHKEWFNKLKNGHWGEYYKQEWEDLDILIFAGDWSSLGYMQEIKNFTKWFSEQPATHKVMIAGNHDYGFETIANFNSGVDKRGNPPTIEELIPDKVTYLNDSFVEILGLKIWGSPITPWFYDWEFNRFRSFGHNGIKGGIKKHWDMAR